MQSLHCLKNAFLIKLITNNHKLFSNIFLSLVMDSAVFYKKRVEQNRQNILKAAVFLIISTKILQNQNCDKTLLN